MKSAYGINIPQTLDDVCDPQRVALVVYDMQVGILSQIKNGDEITRQVLKILTAVRDARVRVFFRDIFPCQKNSWACFSSAWPWLGNASIRLIK
jgi:nicotinamidase-related amidase